jgi:hypothetical protein
MTQEPAGQEAAEQLPEERIAALTDRLRFLPLLTVGQLALGLAAFMVSGSVAWSTYQQAQVARDMRMASVWPRLELGRDMDYGGTADGQDQLSITIVNKGIGPAIVGDARVSLDGRPVRSWGELLDLLGLPLLRDDAPLTGVVLAATESRRLLRVEGPAAEALRAEVDSGRVGISVCYCSVFDQCWRVDPAQPAPEPLRACPDPGPESLGR